MNGGKNKRPQGYTIIEVMIVLAISGFMFLIAAFFISGKQAVAQFMQGVNDMSSRIRATIQEVNDGQYPGGSFDCTGGATLTIAAPSGGTGQGAHSGCVFLGKVLHFRKAGDPEAYEVFSIAGLQSASGGDPNTAKPQAIDNASVNLTDQEKVAQNLDVTGVYVDGPGHSTVSEYALGFLGSLGSVDAVSGQLQSGAQTLAMYYVDHITSGSDDESAVASAIISPGFVPTDKAIICLSDGTRKASITIGANGDSLSTDVGMGNQVQGVC